MYSTGTCVCALSETLWVRFWCPPPALNCKTIQPESTALTLPSRMKFSPNNARRFSPPGWKLSDTSSKAKRGESSVPLMSAGVIFSSISFLLNDFFYPFPICPVCSAPEWMLREKQSEAGCTVLCLTLSLPLTHSCCRPPFSQFLTAPPHPFIFYLLLSFPLTLTDRLRYALLWLSTITVVPLPNHVNQEESPPKLHRGTNSSR